MGEGEEEAVTTKWLNVGGLFLDLVGVVLLFRYGMPYRVRTGGDMFILKGSTINEQIVRAESCYALLGWIGLACIIIGTALQIVGALRQSPTRG